VLGEMLRQRRFFDHFVFLGASLHQSEHFSNVGRAGCLSFVAFRIFRDATFKLAKKLSSRQCRRELKIGSRKPGRNSTTPDDRAKARTVNYVRDAQSIAGSQRNTCYGMQLQCRQPSSTA
jgi:hypothetical protein